MSAAFAQTLPGWLHWQAQRQPQGIALRHKRLGIWQVRHWSALQAEVRSLAAGLAGRGFADGDSLLLLSRPLPQALLLVLAAQWLGGEAVLCDPLDDAAEQVALLDELQPAFVFAQSLEDIQRVLCAGLQPRLLVHAESRGLAGLQLPTALDYGALLASVGQAPEVALARPQQRAFVFYRQTPAGLERHAVEHAELLAEGSRLVREEALGSAEEALAARAFAASGQARYLLAPWLIAGFRLNYPESLETRERDRRELGPTLLLGTRETYGRLHEQVRQRLPLPGSLARRLVDWALDERRGALRGSLGHWLVRRPLRDVLGFSRTRVPLLVGAPLAADAQAFFASLGVAPRGWPLLEHWQPAPRRTQRQWTAVEGGSHA